MQGKRGGLIAGCLILILGTLVTLGARHIGGWGIESKNHVEGFVKKPLTLETYHLFDLGVVDMNGDGLLDIFTVNHSARQSFLFGNKKGKFGDNMLSALKLDQSPEFPGLENTEQSPRFDAPGLYMFWRDANLVLDSYQVDQSANISGIIQLSVPVSTTEDADILIDTTMTTSDGITITTVAFDVQGVGQATIAPLPVPRVGTPLTVTLDELTDLANIFIGNKSRPATQYQFNLALKDRHGMAWAAFSPDNRVDLYIGRGADLGLASSITGEPLSDELFIQNGDRFSAIDTSTVGFDKRGCPARQVGLVDFNSDNLVDIYVVCARNTPNQLYAQIEPGRFEEVASVAGLALEEGGVFRWVDGDVDGDPDLFWASENGFRFFKNESGIFSASLLTDRRLGVQKLAVADYDRDGDPVFLPRLAMAICYFRI